jgi:hypothetical protein
MLNILFFQIIKNHSAMLVVFLYFKLQAQPGHAGLIIGALIIFLSTKK